MSKRLTDIRLEMGDYLDSLATEAMQSSLPIVRPLWMFNSLDPVSYEVDDQVWPLTHLFLFPLCKNNMVCLDGKFGPFNRRGVLVVFR